MPHSISHPPALEGRNLLDELNHRIKNELASVINLVSKEELSNVVCRDPQHSDHAGSRCVRRRRRPLRKLGLAMSRCKLDRMNIHILLSIDKLPLASGRCWLLALAVYELITNAVRHACFDGRDGEIKIKLMLAGSG